MGMRPDHVRPRQEVPYDPHFTNTEAFNGKLEHTDTYPSDGPTNTETLGHILDKLIDDLTQRQQDVLLRVAFERMTLRDIGDELGIAHTTVLEHYRAACRNLRKELLGTPWVQQLAGHLLPDEDQLEEWADEISEPTYDDVTPGFMR